jgi:tetratricopeptide (TPR) repeat protein
MRAGGGPVRFLEVGGRAIGLIGVAALAALAADEEDLARQYLRAHEARDASAQAVLALRPAREVDYALVVGWLQGRGAHDAARALAESRAGAPEGPGLIRLAEAGRLGARLGAAQADALERAADRLRARDARACLGALAEVGTLPEATLASARAAALRAEAHDLAGDAAAALEAWRDAAERARAIGWTRAALRARAREADLAAALGDLPAAAHALDDRVALARDLDAPEERLGAHVARAQALLRLRELERARADLDAARKLAAELGKPLLAAQLTAQIAMAFQLEGMPRRAHDFYAEAVPALRAHGAATEAAKAEVNDAIVLADMGRFDESIAALDALLAREAVEPEVRAEALAQRAHSTARAGRLLSAPEAFRVAIAAAAPARRADLLVGLGQVQLLRWDLAGAERSFREALQISERHAEARQGLAGARALAGDEDAAFAEFDAARADLEAAGDRSAIGRLLLRRAAYERSAGRVDAALASAAEGRNLLAALADAGNVAAANVLLAELHILRGEFAAAAERLEDAAVLYRHLRNLPANASLWVRAGLALRLSGKPREAFETLAKAARQAEALGDDAILASAETALALLEWESGRRAEAVERAERAANLARGAGAMEREAAALGVLVRLAPERAADSAARASACLDAIEALEAEAYLEGESPLDAAGAILAALARAEAGHGALAYAMAERVRALDLAAALRGRDAIVRALFSEERHAEYRDRRAALLEAKRPLRDPGLAAWVASVSPRAARLGFPAPPPVSEVQAALAPKEALLLLVDDRAAQAAVLLTREEVRAAPLDPGGPLAPFGAALEGIERLLVAPDGLFACVPFETARFGDGAVADRFEVAYVANAAAFLARRAAETPGGRTVELADAGVLDFARPQATRVGVRSAVALLAAKVEAPDVLLLGTAPWGAGPRARGEAAAALAEAFPGAVVMRILDAAPPPELLDRYRANRETMHPFAALLAAKRLLRGEARFRNPRHWAGLVAWGVPPR